MSNDTPGIYSKPFKITMYANAFHKGDVIQSSEGTELVVLDEPKTTYSWWAKIILWLFGGKKKLKDTLANGYTYTVKLQHADRSS